MSELVTARISPKKFLRNSKKGKRSKNRFQIELGKTVSPQNDIRLNNFSNISKTNSQKSSDKKSVKTVLKQDRIDKYFRKNLREKIDRERHKKYYKSPKGNSHNRSPKKPVLNNMPKKSNTNNKYNKITVKVNRNYYTNFEKKIFNPNIIKSEFSEYNNMPSEDIYLCNSISQKVTFRN